MYHSYVMGIDNTIMELQTLGFDVGHDGSNYMVSFPEEKSDSWEAFIHKNLELGYWNEYLASDRVVFLFHLGSGVKRYEVFNYESEEVLTLCCKLAECDFASIRSMLEENPFYKDKLI